MQKWLKAGLAVLLAILLAAALSGCGGGKEAVKGPEDTVEAFLNAMVAMNADKAASYCVPDIRDGVRSGVEGIPSGTKISFSKLQLKVTSQTEDTAEVTASFHYKTTYKGETQEGDEENSYTLEKVGTEWLISKFEW